MKILKLEAENFKRIQVVEITPKGHVVPVTGKNASGKSSVLDSIWAALGGKSAVPSTPIRYGEDSATVKLDLGEIIVTRRFTPKDSYLTVEGADGGQIKSPQKLLDDLLGQFTFDPLAFSRMSATEQFEALRSIVNIEVDLEGLDAANDNDYHQRTQLNREASSLMAASDEIETPDDLPEKLIDTDALADELGKVSALEVEVQHRKERYQANREMLKKTKARKAEIEADLAGTVEDIEGLETAIEEYEQRGESTYPNSDEIRSQLSEASTTNHHIGERARKKHLKEHAKNVDKEARALTKKIEARKKQKADAIAKADMPIAGLTLEVGQVLFEEIPFDQCSSAERLRISVSIAMAANPKLKVIRIEEGSLLDEDSMALIAGMAREKDYQVWIERVSDNGQAGIVMEDGTVKADKQAPLFELEKGGA